MSHRHLRIHSMEPYQPNPNRPPTLPLRTQVASIAKLKEIPAGIRVWLLVGPGGTCKTAYVSAWMTDIITLRLAIGGDNLCIWQVSAQDWLTSKQAWDNRDWDDEVTPEPTLSVDVIRHACACSGLRPMVWIEELEKVKITDDRRNLLHDLIDCVYCLKGLVVTTSNITYEQLSDKLGVPLMRRIDGRDDNPSDFILCDFFKEAKTSKTKA